MAVIEVRAREDASETSVIVDVPKPRLTSAKDQLRLVNESAKFDIHWQVDPGAFSLTRPFERTVPKGRARISPIALLQGVGERQYDNRLELVRRKKKGEKPGKKQDDPVIIIEDSRPLRTRGARKSKARAGRKKR